MFILDLDEKVERKFVEFHIYVALAIGEINEI